MTILPRIFPRQQVDHSAEMERSLIRGEAAVGGRLFGPVPVGHRREFFCLDEHTWVWHEEWVDSNGQVQKLTTRYEVRPTGVLKLQEGHGYRPLSRNEARNLYWATKLYNQQISAEYDRLLQVA